MVFKNSLVALSVLLLSSCTLAELSFEDHLRSGSDTFKKALENPKHEIQIIYGEIINDSIKHHYFNVENNQFFYPASTVKMLAAFAAVHKLSEDSLSMKSIISQDSSEIHPRKVQFDSVFNQPESIENLLKHIFTISDNRAYNILYSWLGKDYINTLYKSYGLDTRIVHQLSESAYSFTSESNNKTAKTTLYDTLTINNKKYRAKEYLSKEQSLDLEWTAENQKKGRGFIDASGELVNVPFNFSKKNFVPLVVLMEALERITRPDLFDDSLRFKLPMESQKSLMDIMRLRPSDLPHPLDTLPDNYVKFLMMGDNNEPTYPDSIIIRNKVGWAYGYLTDVAYIEDKVNNISFFLAATIHVNENEIYNDGIYEYETVGLPFLGELGRIVHQIEIDKK
ncbi:MAG: serine hydrolase [Ekhidna sp.]